MSHTQDLQQLLEKQRTNLENYNTTAKSKRLTFSCSFFGVSRFNLSDMQTTALILITKQNKFK